MGGVDVGRKHLVQLRRVLLFRSIEYSTPSTANVRDAVASVPSAPAKPESTASVGVEGGS